MAEIVPKNRNSKFAKHPLNRQIFKTALETSNQEESQFEKRPSKNQSEVSSDIKHLPKKSETEVFDEARVTNVNTYLPILKDKKTNEGAIEWVVHLREPVEIRVPSPVILQVSSKMIKSGIHKTPSDIKYQGNAHDIWHLLNRPLGPSPSKGQVLFETSLRAYQAFDQLKRAKKPVPKFDTITVNKNSTELISKAES